MLVIAWSTYQFNNLHMPYLQPYQANLHAAAALQTQVQDRTKGVLDSAKHGNNIHPPQLATARHLPAIWPKKRDGHSRAE
jgi:hypothetical protein